MPHHKMSIRRAVVAANVWLDDVRDNPEKSAQIAGATDLVALAQAAGLDGDSLESIGQLHPEIQGVALEAIKQAAANGREVYITWRHGVVQGLHVSVPGPALPGAAVDIELQSGFYSDGINTDPQQS